MAVTPRFSVEPIRATRTFEAAIEHLTEAIERAGLRAGDRLPNEGALAAELGISKPTLRQALRVLELSGLVEVRRGKAGGVFVVTDLVPAVAIFSAVKLEEDAAVDVLHGRRVLERAVVHEAMRAATAADISELQRTIDLLERHLGERPSVMRADAMFHRALVRACRNETIQAAMRGVARGLAPIRDAYSGGIAYDRETLDVHRRQLHAMERRDRCRAGGGARRALPHARDAVREGHRPALVGPVRPRARRPGWRTGSVRSAGRRDAASSVASISPICTSLRPCLTTTGGTRDEARSPSPPGHQRGHGVPLGLEDRRVDVAEVLAVDLERQRLVAADRDPLHVVEDDHPRPRPRSAEQLEPEPGEIASADPRRRHDVDAEVERGSARDPDPDAARVGVRVAVRDERERRSAVAVHLERVREAAATRREQPQRLADEGRVARPSSVLPSTPRVDPADELGVEPDPRVEARSGAR